MDVAVGRGPATRAPLEERRPGAGPPPPPHPHAGGTEQVRERHVDARRSEGHHGPVAAQSLLLVARLHRGRGDVLYADGGRDAALLLLSEEG